LILKYAKLVDQTFKVPSRKTIGGPLPDLNYKNCMTLNKEMILKEADVFGLAWLSNGATVSHTDIFFFDGASNVAKAGQVLQAKFPRSYSLHGGEHVVSLFFDDISKLPPIKVSVVFHFYAFLLIECDLTF